MLFPKPHHNYKEKNLQQTQQKQVTKTLLGKTTLPQKKMWGRDGEERETERNKS
jgi:hypothetical protein